MTNQTKKDLFEFVDKLVTDEIDNRLERFKPRFSTTASCLEVVFEDPKNDLDCATSWAFTELLPKDKVQRQACIELIRYVLDEEDEENKL